MKADWLLFRRLIARPLVHEPIRTALTVAAVALGVGVVIAIQLAGNAAAGSFRSSLESLTGKNSLVMTQTGGIDENLLGKLVQLPYPIRFSPRIEDFAFINGKGEALPFIGVDLIANSTVAGSTAKVASETMTNPIWVGGQLGLRRGAQVKLVIEDAARIFTVAGVLPASAGRVIVADIGLAQLVTRKTGKLDSIEVQLRGDGSAESWRKLLEQQVPPSVNVEPQGTRTADNRKMLAAFRWNLNVLSQIALIVGGFLIYNTISISVTRRRNEIGIVRALGGTRRMIAAAFLAEAGLIGIAGSVFGLLVGRLMAIGAVGLIGSTVQALYVSSQPAPIELTAGAMGAGMILGIAISAFASLAPALEASHVTPVEAMARAREQYAAAVRAPQLSRWAALALVVAAGFSRVPAIHGQPVFAYVAAMLLIAATAALIPRTIVFFSGAVDRTIERLAGVEALLAMRSLHGSLARSAVLTAALATAVAMTASVGIMVGSFRETVRVWMNNELKADFYLRPAGSSGADRHPAISPEIADRIERVAGVRAVDRFRAYPIFYEGLPATLAGGETSTIEGSGTTRFLPGEDRDRILAELPAGNYAIVSEPFANKHDVHAGSTLQLPIGGGLHAFKVLGIYYDYSTERGFIVLDRRTLLKYLPDPAASNLAVYLTADADPERVREAIDGAIAGRAVLVFSNRDLRRGAIAVFDRTFRITYALEAVAVIVAVMGIAGALLAMAIDRRRELALLRFLGAAQWQVKRIILCEAGLLGLLANAVGLLLGTALSLILIFVINKQSFGWTIQFHFPVAMLLAALMGVYAATVLAGLYPGRMATRTNPIEVIHEE